MTAERRETQLPISDQIIWPAKPALRDRGLWTRNVAIVQELSRSADLVEWLNGTPGIDTYMHMPRTYLINDVSVEFLPHWGFIKINGSSHDLADETDTRTTRRAFKNIKLNINRARTDIGPISKSIKSAAILFARSK